jgi:ribosomal protein S18 acetylase RimI-like enzyme
MIQRPILRHAKTSDARDIARVFVNSWRDAYAGVLPQRYLVGLSVDLTAQRWRIRLSRGDPGASTFVAEDPTAGLVGYGNCGVKRTPLPAGMDGEFYELYVDPAAQGRRVGRALMSEMAAHLVARRMRSACVWVLRDNPARWFYHHLGGRTVAEGSIRYAGAQLSQVAYAWPDLASLTRLARSVDGTA